MKRTNLIQDGLVLNEAMPTTSVVGDKKSSFKKVIKDYIILVILAIFFLFGLIGGSLFIRNADFSALEKLDFLFFSNFEGRVASQLTSVFVASLASSFSFILLCFLCGLSMWGAFLIPAIPFFRGFGLGMTGGYLYAAYGWHGLLYQLSIILPGALLCMIAILFAAREGISFSRKISFRSKEETEESSKQPPKMSIKTYFIRYTFIIGTTLIAALIDVATTACFSGLFSF